MPGAAAMQRTIRTEKILRRRSALTGILNIMPQKPMLELVSIPSGPFTMGISDARLRRLTATLDEARAWRGEGRFEREQPSHQVALPAYSIAKRPITVSEYRQFIEEDGYQLEAFWTHAGWKWRNRMARTCPDHWANPLWTGSDLLPVVGVSWYEAVAFCIWLSLRLSRSVRLPSEAEWEKAARGPNGLLYPWGEEFDSNLCNTRSGGLGRTRPVDAEPSLGESSSGVSGLIGNVSEWTSSQFVPYPYDPLDGREDPEGERVRVTRGGSWFSPDLRARATCRGMNDPWFTDHDLGFRVAASVPSQ